MHWFLTFICLLLSPIVLVHATETVEDAAVLARLLIDSSAGIGTMATIYPSDHPSLADQPFALQEYYASCHRNGSLALIFMPISRHSQNILQSPSHAASITVWTSPPAASRARVSLTGSVTILYDETAGDDGVRKCYLQKHPDAQQWVPGGRDAPHRAYWARFDPHSIYFVGGFGDEHYIGPVPLPLYQGAPHDVHPDPSHSLAGRIIVQGDNMRNHDSELSRFLHP